MCVLDYKICWIGLRYTTHPDIILNIWFYLVFSEALPERWGMRVWGNGSFCQLKNIFPTANWGWRPLQGSSLRHLYLCALLLPLAQSKPSHCQPCCSMQSLFGSYYLSILEKEITPTAIMKNIPIFLLFNWAIILT
jgi:hypothetical protein